MNLTAPLLLHCTINFSPFKLICSKYYVQKQLSYILLIFYSIQNTLILFNI